jgi:hypothetical protein
MSTNPLSFCLSSKTAISNNSDDVFFQCTSMMYVNQVCSYNQLLTRINDIDYLSVVELSQNVEFENFIRHCVDVIDEYKVIRNIRIEHLKNSDEKGFRLIYHLNKSIDTSFISKEVKVFKRRDRPTYLKILSKLFKQSSELKNMMVIDERSF